MDKIKVVSQRNLSRELGWIDIRVDRASVLGNPFELINESQREEVIVHYKLWLWRNINANKNVFIKPNSINPEIVISSRFKEPNSLVVRSELNRLKLMVKGGSKLRLLCWCSPKKCHGDVLKSCIEWLVKGDIKLM